MKYVTYDLQTEAIISAGLKLLREHLCPVKLKTVSKLAFGFGFVLVKTIINENLSNPDPLKGL